MKQLIAILLLAGLFASCTKMKEEEPSTEALSGIGPVPVPSYTWQELATPQNGTVYPSNGPYRESYTALVGDTYWAWVGDAKEKVYKLNKTTLRWESQYTMSDVNGYLFYEHEILFNYNSKIYYSFNNYTDRFFSSYDPVSRTKTTLAPFPGSQDSIGSPRTFVVGDYGYLFFDGGFGQYWKYGFHTNTWTLLGENPLGARYGATIAVVGDKVYAGLGWEKGTNPDPNVFDRVYKRDWVQFQVDVPGKVTKAQFPGLSRDNAQACVVNDNIYVAFGYMVNTAWDPPTRWRYDLFKYNTNSNTWGQCADWPGITVTQPAGFDPLHTKVSMFAMGNSVYTISGGIYEFWRYSNQQIIVGTN